MTIEVVPATADRWDDVALILGPRNPDSPACWCLYFRLTSSEFDKVKGRDRPNYLQALCARDESPGLVAYRDGEPVGWCALGPRQEFGRLERSRTIPKVDDRPVWSVVCFVVRPGHRRQGVAGALLGGAVDSARSRGRWRWRAIRWTPAAPGSALPSPTWDRPQCSNAPGSPASSRPRPAAMGCRAG